MRIKAVFTDRTLNALNTDSYYLDVFDRSVPGFGIRVSKTGKKRFFLIYREPGSVQARLRRSRRLPLGTYPDVRLAMARQAAREATAAVSEGRDPRGPLTAATAGVGPTWGYLVDKYLQKKSTHKKDGGAVDRRMFGTLPDDWTARSLPSFTKQEMRDFIGPRRASSPVGSNRLQSFLSAVWNFGVREDLATFNPWAGIDMFDERKAREKHGTTRALKLPEIKIFLNEAGDHIGSRVAKCILYTAQRPGEVMGMRWEELDGNWWTLPAARTKNGREHRIFLTPEVRALLGTRNGTSPYAFPARDNKRLSTGHLNTIHAHLARIIDRLGMQPFTPHDLRRTAATHLSRIGVAEEVREEILNHKPTILKQTYNLYRFDAQKEEALTMWAGELRRIATSA